VTETLTLGFLHIYDFSEEAQIQIETDACKRLTILFRSKEGKQIFKKMLF
jgi:hypothetical protein